MPTKRVATQVYQNRYYSDDENRGFGYGGPSGYVPQGGGRGSGFGPPAPRRFSLPPAPYSDDRRRYYDQGRHGSGSDSSRHGTITGNKKDKRRSRETRSQSRNRKGSGTPTPQQQQQQQQIRNDRRRSMDSHMYQGGGRRHGGSRDPSPHVWEMTHTANYQQQSRWTREHSPMYRAMTEYYGGGGNYYEQYRPRSREASPGYYRPQSPGSGYGPGPHSPMYSPQSPGYPGDNWHPFPGKRAASRDPSPHYGEASSYYCEGSGYTYRSLPRRPPSREPSPHQFPRDKPPRHQQRKPSSRPNSRDPSPNYGDFGYVRTILFDRRPVKDQPFPQSDTHCDSVHLKQGADGRNVMKGKGIVGP